MPDWITAAIMVNNTASFPLLLMQSLGDTGILNFLMLKGENTHDTIERAKSYFLVFAKVSSCLTFAVGPRMIDSEHIPDAQDDGDGDNDNQLDDDGGETIRHNNELRDRSLLLNPNAPQRHGAVPPIVFSHIP